MSNVVPMAGRELVEIPLDKIVEDPFLPRKSYSDASLHELGTSLAGQGLLQSIVVTPAPGGTFRLIVGSRRIRAARTQGYSSIPGIVIEVESSREIMLLALTENLHREDLEPLEEANAYLWLCQEHDMSPADVARHVRKSVGTVLNRLKLLDLAPEVQKFVVDEVINPSTAAALVHLSSGEEQLAVAEIAARDHLTAAETVSLIKEEGMRFVQTRGQRIANVQKYRLTLLGIRQKIETGFAAVETLPMTPEERGRLMKALLELEEASKRIRDRISNQGRVATAPSLPRKSSGNVPTARSHGDEWPAGHVKLLEDPTLSDEDVAEQAGRTVNAVQSMRKELRRTRSRRK